MGYDPDEPHFACWFPEAPYTLGTTLLCGVPCSACLVVAEVELNKLNPLTADREMVAWWYGAVGVLAGEVDVDV
jgi:hypothetical protein